MPNIFRVLLLSMLFATLILAGIYAPELLEYLTHNQELAQKEKALFNEAEQLLAKGRPAESLSLAKDKIKEIDPTTPQGKAWLELLVRGSEDLPDSDQLKEIFSFYPDALKGHEKGALLLASMQIAQGDLTNYERLRALFKSQETDLKAWFILDADSLILAGEPESAVRYLKSRYFEGRDDTPRLMRLALLHLNHHPKVTWDYLAQAVDKDPQNPDIALFRVRLLESAGKGDIAELEWDRALGNGALNDTLLKEELINFNLGRGNYEKARSQIQKDILTTSKASLLLKALFLSNAIEPLSFPFTHKGSEIESYITSIPQGSFWSEATLPNDLKSKQSLNEEGAVLWLKTLENLRLNREADALTLLEHNLLNTSIDPELRGALASLLHYRLEGTFSQKGLTKDQDLTPFETLTRYGTEVEPSTEMKSFLEGPEALSTLFLSRGWNESALKLNPNLTNSQISPEWVSLALANAVKKNRGIKEALSYLSLQEQIPPVRILKAVYLLENEDEVEGEKELNELADLFGEEGKKAALLLARRAFSKGEWNTAKLSLLKQRSVEISPEGQELLARIALEENDSEEATKIYKGIENESSEAASFLAKRAFEQGDYKEAYRLTETLLKANPNSSILKENLKLLLEQLPHSNDKSN